MFLFKDRFEAGEKLGKFLKDKLDIKNKDNWIILYIPRWWLPIAINVADILWLKYFPIIVKKLAPLYMEEYWFGAMAPDGNILYDESYMRFLWVDDEQLNSIKQKVFEEIIQRIKKYAFGILPDVKWKNVIIVDDWIATGYTAAVAWLWAKNQGAIKVILAIPVCPGNINWQIFWDLQSKLKNYFDEIYCLYPMTDFQAVGQYYQDFHQIEDEEYFSLLRKWRK